jgi:hypothetical protein
MCSRCSKNGIAVLSTEDKLSWIVQIESVPEGFRVMQSGVRCRPSRLHGRQEIVKNACEFWAEMLLLGPHHLVTKIFDDLRHASRGEPTGVSQDHHSGRDCGGARQCKALGCFSSRER